MAVIRSMIIIPGPIFAMLALIGLAAIFEARVGMVQKCAGKMRVVATVGRSRRHTGGAKRRDFDCGWLVGSHQFGDEWFPARCKMIITRREPRYILAERGMLVTVGDFSRKRIEADMIAGPAWTLSLCLAHIERKDGRGGARADSVVRPNGLTKFGITHHVENRRKRFA